uniref:Variant surface glycoprotein 1125.189 n=1 Tax=Trypanosoma brucei TaxID=5691 RepID=A0A1J0R5F2_9TRYP|nr:variant surface glycoprotein 1125.189 [Trypanosoma brucei]
MQPTMSAIAISVIVAIAALKQARAVSDGDNAAIFKLLCAALQLADVKPTFEPPIQPKMPELVDLYRLNMSIAPKHWRAKFLKPDNKATPTPADLPAGEKDEAIKTRWKTWTDTAVFLATGNNEKELKANYGLATATDDQIDAIRPTVHDIVETAHDIYTETTNSGQTPQADDNLLQKEIAEAVYGEEKWAPNTLNALKVLAGADAGYTTACGGASTQKPQTTIAGTIICVCGCASGANHKPCNKNQANAATWQGSNIPDETTWGYIRTICPKATTTKLTAAKLTAITTAAKTITNIQNNDVFIGSEDKSSCDGDVNGACVKITAGAQSGSLKTDAIPWISKLEGVAEKLAERDSYNDEAQRQKAAISNLKSRAKAVTKRAHYLIQIQKKPQQAAAGEATEGKVSKADCKQYTTNSTCPKNDCKWEEKDGKDGKCVVDEAKATAHTNTAGTKGTAKEGTTSTGCATHKDKTACENDKKDDKQNCAWRKGKDNEDDKDTEKCAALPVSLSMANSL